MGSILEFRAADVLGGKRRSAEPGDLFERRQIDTVRDRRSETIVFRLARGHGTRAVAGGKSLPPAQRPEKGGTQRVVFEDPVKHRARYRAVGAYRAVERVGW